MSFIKKFSKAHNPVTAIKKNPVSAYMNEKKRGGDMMSSVTAALDPHETFGNNRTLTAEESAASLKKQRAEAKKRKATGMKAGGKTRASCRGMGKATRGGGYGK